MHERKLYKIRSPCPAPTRAGRLFAFAMSGFEARVRIVFVGVLVLLAGVAVAVLAGSEATRSLPRPRLVVLLVVDQLRRDYLDRHADFFLPPGNQGGDAGGFAYLSERGARFTAARYQHLPLQTGPGHATIATGGTP